MNPKFFVAVVSILLVGLFTFIGINIYQEHQSVKEIQGIHEKYAHIETKFDSELDGQYTYYENDLQFDFVQNPDTPYIVDLYVSPDPNHPEHKWTFLDDWEEVSQLHVVFVLDGYQFKDLVADPKYFVNAFYRKYNIIHHNK